METKIASVASVDEATDKQIQPIFASGVAAGFGVPGDDTVDEALNIQQLLVKNPTATFFVRVSGDSMEGARIFDGDVLVVDRSVGAKDNSIVVAAINGELVVKRLKYTGAKGKLISENPAYKPIDLTDKDDCFIWGVVVGSARKFA